MPEQVSHQTQLALPPPSKPVSTAPTSQPDPKIKLYPAPAARYEEVVSNAQMFMVTLEHLHRTMGTKFLVPTLGGRALDLHRLFVEVTSRGGLEQVIKDRKWRDVIAAFSFPNTITNASFVLRKYYISLLHHYEQVYFFRTQGWPVPVTASLPAAKLEASQVQAAIPAEKEDASKNQPIASSSLPVGRYVTGTIDGKIENGYLVTVNFGLDKLKGILYHVPLELQNTQIAKANGSSSAAVELRRHRKKSRLVSKDPSHPKPNKSGYNFFFAEHYARLKPSYSGQERSISRKIGYLWSKLTEAEKAVYQEKGVKDKERYKTEMMEYRKSSAYSKPQ